MKSRPRRPISAARATSAESPAAETTSPFDPLGAASEDPGTGGAPLAPGAPCSAPPRPAGSSPVSGRSQFGDHVIDSVADGAEVLEVLVLDAEPDRPLAELFLEALDELDQRQ